MSTTTRGSRFRGGPVGAGRRGEAAPAEEHARVPPSMNRSAGQLASSYAPMRHFAFENGLGVCMSVPVEAPAARLTGNTPDQIHRRLNEAARAWFEAGRARLDPEREPLLLHLLVDPGLYDQVEGRFEYRRDVFGFVEPREMGYEVSPTTLVCSTCGLLKPCETARRMADFLGGDAERECQDPNRRSPDAGRCRWRQFEPIFVHPSGAWRSVDVAPLDLLPSGEPARRTPSCEACGHRQFKVDMSKVTLGGWFLKCAKCGVRKGTAWTDHDEDYLRVGARLARQAAGEGGGPAAPARWNPDDTRMEKISYGAAIAFIPQSETFIDLPDADILRLTEEHGLEGLCEFVGLSSGYVAAAPTPETAVQELERGGEEARLLAARIQRGLSRAAKLASLDQAMAEEQLEEVRGAVEEGRAKGLLRLQVALPPDLREKVKHRSRSWSSRYDPFQLAIEHEALAKTKLAALPEGPRKSYVRFDAPDPQLMPADHETGRADADADRVRAALATLGIREAGLIPRFELCRFTYGYSRTSSVPVHPKRDIPVRLKLFPRVKVGGQSDTVHPVYVMRQKNEAFYFRLDEGRVRHWLQMLQCADADLLASEPSLRAALFRSALPMDRFLTEHDRDAGSPPRLYTATYGLVHGMAHHVIRTMSRLSGLDEGGMGEYLFPADLAFVVYRSGMTMDLGDLSSLWRNSWQSFLSELCDHPNSLGCNIGSLCAEGGGACPDCLMIPEVVCVAGNRYLSRSLLTGEGRSSFFERPSGVPTIGYLRLGGEGADAPP